MAITFNTDRLQGMMGITINGVYCRIQTVTIKKYDTDPVAWGCLYSVVMHASEDIRNSENEYPTWPNKLSSREINSFTCTYDPTSNSNPYAQAYADLKVKLAATSTDVNGNAVTAKASSIADIQEDYGRSNTILNHKIQ